MIEVGSVWRDKDSRMLSRNRRVRVVRADDRNVWYISSYHGSRGEKDHTPFRSKAARFVKAFEKIEEKQ